jgi:hypothetical protein|tara:strand:+ start:229 stop:426 length:198 start_codon:yes stop_codon:yes gene_type:complete
MAPSGPLCYNAIINKRRNMNTEEQIIVLAQINTLKEMQIFCLKKEQELQQELKRLKDLEKERTKV